MSHVSENEISIRDMEAEEESLRKEFEEFLPRAGDRLFVENENGVRIDPLGYSDPFQPETRSHIGRRSLYTDGFIEAGNRLVAGLGGQNLTISPAADLVYPILFLYRHHLELALKSLAAYSIHLAPGIIEAEIQKEQTKLGKTHELLTLWDVIQRNCPKCNDWASKEQQDCFNSLLAELQEHDPDGQAGRYQTDSKGNSTLSKLSLVDLGKLKSGIRKMSHYLGSVYEHVASQSDTSD